MCVVSDAQRTLVLTSEPSLSLGPLCERHVLFTCIGTELPFILHWVVNGSIFAVYAFSSTHTYPFPLDPVPSASSFPPGVVVNVNDATLSPNVANAIDITTILDVSDVSVLDRSSLRCEDSIQLTRSNVITPRAHARARGYVIGRGVYILYIYYILLYICKTFFLSFKILTFRRPFQHRKASLRI